MSVLNDGDIGSAMDFSVKSDWVREQDISNAKPMPVLVVQYKTNASQMPYLKPIRTPLSLP